MKLARRFHKWTLLACLVGATGPASSAWAGSLTADLKSIDGGGLGPYTSNLNVQFTTSNGQWERYDASLVGRINWTNVRVPGDLNIPFTPSDPGYGFFQTGSNFFSFCIEGTQNVYAPGTAHFVTTSLASAPGTANIAAGLLNGMGNQRAAWLTEFWNRNIAGVIDNATAAGFQIGIWSILYNANPTASDMSFFDISNVNKFSAISGNHFQVLNASLQYVNGNLTGSDPALVQAAKMLANVTGGQYTHLYDLVALTDPVYQDQLVAIPAPVGQPPVVAPLPAAFPAGAALLVGLLGARTLRRRTAEL